MKVARHWHRARRLQGRRGSRSKFKGYTWPGLTQTQVHRALATFPKGSDAWWRWNPHHRDTKYDPPGLREQSRIDWLKACIAEGFAPPGITDAERKRYTLHAARMGVDLNATGEDV